MLRVPKWAHVIIKLSVSPLCLLSVVCFSDYSLKTVILYHIRHFNTIKLENLLNILWYKITVLENLYYLCINIQPCVTNSSPWAEKKYARMVPKKGAKTESTSVCYTPWQGSDTGQTELWVACPHYLPCKKHLPLLYAVSSLGVQ